MNFWDVFGQMLVILTAIAAGFLASHLGFLNAEADQRLSRTVLNITNPCMIVGAVATGSALPETSVILRILLVALVFYVVEFAAVLALPHLVGGTPAQKGVWRFVLAFPNVGFIGYPVAVALFGEEALFYAVVLTIPFNLLSFTLGPLMLGGELRFSWKQFLTPCIVASVISLAVALTHTQIPAQIGEMLDMVGDVTVPLALMLVGSELAKLPLRQMLGGPRVWAVVIIRLLALPVLFSGVLLLLMDLPEMLYGVAVSQMAMPVAVTGTLMCATYGGDQRSMAQVTFLTTVMSIVTIPILAVTLM